MYVKDRKHPQCLRANQALPGTRIRIAPRAAKLHSGLCRVAIRLPNQAKGPSIHGGPPHPEMVRKNCPVFADHFLRPKKKQSSLHNSPAVQDVSQIREEEVAPRFFVFGNKKTLRSLCKYLAITFMIQLIIFLSIAGIMFLAQSF